jgi:7-cyano-7-deazaguanine synthase
MREVLQLLSGGIDSSACIQFLLEANFSIRPFFIDFGQSAAVKEREASLSICHFFGLKLEEARVLDLGHFDGGLIQGRNQFLISTALLKCSSQTSFISLGIHSGTEYLDCSEDFLISMQQLVNKTTTRQIHLIAPFLSWKKHEIWQYILERKLPIEKMVSCEKGFLEACGICPSCLERKFLESHEK